MKKSDLAYCLHQDIENWEIVNIGYDNISKRVDLLLRNFELKSLPFGSDYKEYNNKLKKINIMDEYAFVYYEDSEIVNAIEEFVCENKDINLNKIKELVKNPEDLFTTSIQAGWKKILQSLGCFDVDSYRIKFLKEFKKYYFQYAKDTSNEDIIETMKFFEKLNLDLE